VDAAGAAYGILAFAAVASFGAGARPAVLSGLCLGWALASRYTDLVLLPSWLALLWMQRGVGPRFSRLLAPAAAGLAAGWLPMIAKNWALGVHAFAPLVNDPHQFWGHMRRWEGSQVNLSGLDVLLRPLVATFADRPGMLGTVSPLFLGLVPAFVLLRRDAGV